jgi:hypothetical protein
MARLRRGLTPTETFTNFIYNQRREAQGKLGHPRSCADATGAAYQCPCHDRRARNSAHRRDGQNDAHGADWCRGEDVTSP